MIRARSLLMPLFLCAAAFSVAVATPARAEETVLKIATQAPEGTPWAELMVRYRKAVEKASNGRVKVKVFLGGKAGDENETVRKTGRGHLQGVAASTGSIATLVPELNMIEIPFLFSGFGEADYVLDEVLTQPMEKLFRDRGLVLAFWSENGFRHFGTNFGEIHKPGDLSGKKMRAQESKVHDWMWKTLKAASQPIPTTEVLTSLETGGVDGFDQTLLFALAAKWHKALTGSSKKPTITLSAHIYQPAAVAFNKEWFDKLPADLQTILIDEGRKLQPVGRKLIRGMNKDLIELVKKDVSVYTLTGPERAAFKAVFDSGRQAFVDGQGAEAKKVFSLILGGISAFKTKGK